MTINLTKGESVIEDCNKFWHYVRSTSSNWEQSKLNARLYKVAQTLQTTHVSYYECCEILWRTEYDI